MSKWLSVNDGRKMVGFRAINVLYTRNWSSKRVVSGGCHPADTIHSEKWAAIHSSISLTLTQTPFNHHLGKFRPR